MSDASIFPLHWYFCFFSSVLNFISYCMPSLWFIRNFLLKKFIPFLVYCLNVCSISNKSYFLLNKKCFFFRFYRLHWESSPKSLKRYHSYGVRRRFINNQVNLNRKSSLFGEYFVSIKKYLKIVSMHDTRKE